MANKGNMARDVRKMYKEAAEAQDASVLISMREADQLVPVGCDAVKMKQARDLTHEFIAGGKLMLKQLEKGSTRKAEYKRMMEKSGIYLERIDKISNK